MKSVRYLTHARFVPKLHTEAACTKKVRHHESDNAPTSLTAKPHVVAISSIAFDGVIYLS